MGSDRHVPGIHNEHVDPAPREFGDDGKHECPYKTCQRRVSAQYLACRAHWMKVPLVLRDALYEALSAPPDVYLAVRAECVQAMNAR